MSYKIFIIVLQLITLAICTGAYLTFGAYLMRGYKGQSAEYGFSMRFLIGIIMLVTVIIACLGK